MDAVEMTDSPTELMPPCVCGEHPMVSLDAPTRCGRDAALLGALEDLIAQARRISPLRDELMPLIRELGRMPTRRELEARDRRTLLSRIIGAGGFVAVARVFGTTVKASWRLGPSDEAATIEALRPIVAEAGYLPTLAEIRARGLEPLARAMTRFGGRCHFARLLGAPLVPEWTSERLGAELMAYVGPDRAMPSQEMLRTQGRADLCHRILRAGGFAAVAAKLGLSYGGRGRGRSARDWTIERLRRELTAYAGPRRQMPTYMALRRAGRADLCHAIADAGGFAIMASLCGLAY